MGLQEILAVCESITINDHRFIGQMLSRNMRLSTSAILTVQPFQFELRPMNYLLYSQNRDVLSSLREADRQFEQYLSFSTTGWVNYIAYRGNMTSVQINACTIEVGTAEKTIVLGNLPTLTPTAFIVRTGDFIQIDRYSYIATQDVLRGGSSTVSVPVHRTVMTTVSSALPAVIGQYGTTTALGGTTYTGITFPLVMQDYPTYSLIPMANDSFIQWSGTFKAIEVVL